MRELEGLCRLGFIWSLALVVLGCAGRGAARHLPAANDELQSQLGEPCAGQARATADGCACSVAFGESALIDDFEDGDLFVSALDQRGGIWGSYDDGSGGTVNRAVEVAGAGRALRITSQGFTGFGAAVFATLHPGSSRSRACLHDASRYTGVRFRARSSTPVRLALESRATVTLDRGGACSLARDACFDQHGAVVPASDEWRDYEFPFCQLVPEGWGGEKGPLDPSALSAIHFRLRESPAELWLDDLSFTLDDGSGCSGTATCTITAAPAGALYQPELLDPSLAALGLSVHTFPQASESCGTLIRRYLAYVPATLAPGTHAEVLIVLHGTGGNAESARGFQAQGRFDELAREHGFVVIYGNAMPSPRSQPFPNSGQWRADYVASDGVDDDEYLRLLVDDLKQRGVIAGENPIYLIGHSNGGGMALDAARRHPERYTGVAAFMPYAGSRPAAPVATANSRLSGALFVYSLGDPTLAEYAPRVARLAQDWARNLGVPAALISQPAETQLPDLVVEGDMYTGDAPTALATRDSRVRQLDFGPAAAGGPAVRSLIIERGGHFWPTRSYADPAAVLAQHGLRNQDIDGAEQVWHFFGARRRGASD